MWLSFRTNFEANVRRPLPDTTGPHGVPSHARAEVAASLARFQLGEAGEGRIATAIDRFVTPAIDEDYRLALKLFVKEEGRHARILGALVLELGGTLLGKTWTESLFVAGRRMAGIRLKLLVLLVAEVVGIAFYREIADRLDDGCVRRALHQICGDEEQHLTFHRAFFLRIAPSGLLRAVFLAGYGALRFATEQFREPDNGVAMVGSLTLPMLLSISMIVAGAGFFAMSRRSPLIGGLLRKTE